MKTKVKVVFSQPVYTLGWSEPSERAKATVVRGPFDWVTRVRHRLVGAIAVPGKADSLVMISEEDDVYGGAMRGQVKCHKVEGFARGDDSAYFESYTIAAVDQFEPERSPGHQALIDADKAIGPQTTQYERRSWRHGTGTVAKLPQES